MHADAPWRIAPFDGKTHNRSTFSCCAPELDRYIQEIASQDVKRDVARVFVALDHTNAVLGFYSLSAGSFQKDALPPAQAKKLPHYPVPAVLLGRLAVDQNSKGRGLGVHLLMDALNRVLLASQALAVHAIIVDARDDTAAAFYRKYGFITFTGSPRRLFLTMATLRQLIGE
ncbi:MAG: GNAT family N-acetyltransferase [Rhodospirillales bacterium]|nr:GNAT family N-acetyltransferase [Rhodospirillales bacterium]